MAETIIFNGTDVSEYISPASAVHEMNCGGRADTLDLTFEDTDHLWPKWAPKTGDTIEYRNDGTSTGKMYIYDLEYTENEVRLYAQNTAPKYMAAYSKTWEEVYLSQILSEITDSYQLNGIDDVWYKYKPCNTKLISFMNTMAELEGAALIQYNDKVMLVNEQALEAQTPLFQVNCAGASIRINDETEELFDACVVQSGGFFGSYRISDGSNVYRPNITVPCASDAEAFRYARALLRYANKGKTMVRWQGTLIPELSAGVCIDLVNEDIPSWAGTMFCYRVRHDYGKGQTTIFMRRPLEGY